MSNIIGTTLAGAMLGALLLGAAPPSSAATQPYKYKQNGAGACVGALPAFAGTLRARPLALQNEGSSSAFVTCSLGYDDFYGEPVTEISVVLINNGTVAQSISCTLVNGSVVDGTAYAGKTTSVSSGTFGLTTFYLSDFSPAPTTIARPNISCSLPANTGVGYIFYSSRRQVGN